MKKKDTYRVPMSYYYSPNQYGFGSFMNRLTSPGEYDKETGRYTSGAFNGWSKNGVQALTSGLPIVGSLAGTAIGGGFSSKAGSVVDGLSNIASAIPGPWGAIAGAGLKVVGGLVNRAFGAKFNDANIKEVEANTRNLRNFTSNAGSYEQLTANMLSSPAAMSFNQDFIGKNGWFNHKATRKYEKLKAAQGAAAQFVTNSLNNNMNNITTNQARQLASNFAALGGLLFPQKSNRYDDGGEMDDDMDKVRRLQLLEQQLQMEMARRKDPYRITIPGEDSYGIRREADALRRQQYLSSINRIQDATRRADENLQIQVHNARAQAQRAENQEYINAVRRQLDARRNPEYINAVDREQNSTKRLKQQKEYINSLERYDTQPEIYVYPEDEYANGGIVTLLGDGVMSPFGKRFAKGGNAETDPAYGYRGNGDVELVYINNGGTHEQNPRGGTQYGKDSKGTPNLVEQGEVVIRSKDDKVPPFVVSNKVLMDEDFKKRNKLRGKTYADGLKYANKEAIERPFSQISNNYINHISKEVMAAQERTKDREKRKQAAEQMAAYLNQAAEGGLLDSYEFPLFAFGGPMDANVLELGTDYVDWINSLSDDDYINVLKSIYSKYSERDQKKYIRRYGKNRQALIDTANRGTPGTVFNGITSAYNTAKGIKDSEGSEGAKEFSWTDNTFNDWYKSMKDEDYATLLRGAYGENSDQYKKYIKDREGFLKFAQSNEAAGNVIKNAYSPQSGLSDKELEGVVVNGHRFDPYKPKYYKNGIWDSGFWDYGQKVLNGEVVFNPDEKYGHIEGFDYDPENGGYGEDYANNIEKVLTPEGITTRFGQTLERQYDEYLKEQNKKEDTVSLPPKQWGWGEGLMMVSPAVELGLAFSDRLGYTNQADESAANALNRASTQIRDIRPQFIGNRLKLQRPDPRLQENALKELAGKTIDSNINLSGGNRGQAIANNLASAYNYLGQLGAANIVGMQNLNDIQKAEYDANILTDKFNAEQDLKAQVANGEAQKLRMTTLAQEQALRDAAWAKASGIQSANAAAALQDLYKLGVHFTNRNDRDWLAEAGIFGTLPWMARRASDQEAKIKSLEDEIARLQGLIPEEEEEETLSQGTSNRKGGYVRTKKRKRRGITI